MREGLNVAGYINYTTLPAMLAMCALCASCVLPSAVYGGEIANIKLQAGIMKQHAPYQGIVVRIGWNNTYA